jgi:hypothetical protein
MMKLLTIVDSIFKYSTFLTIRKVVRQGYLLLVQSNLVLPVSDEGFGSALPQIDEQYNVQVNELIQAELVEYENDSDGITDLMST